MNPKAIDKAKARIQRAKQALDRLDQGDGFKRFETEWTDFLLASNTVYTALEQGAKNSPQSRQWFGRKKRERADDPLLQYLHQARNADEHGLERIVDRKQEGLDIEFNQNYRPKSGFIKMKDGTVFNFPAIPSIAGGMIIEAWKFTLVTIKDDRYGNTFDPPSAHLGKILNDGANPKFVGRLALTYQAGLIAEAEALVVRVPSPKKFD